MRACADRQPAASASAATSLKKWGWLSLSASPFASLGTDTASHWLVSSCAPRRSSRMAAAPLEAELSAAAAGSQSPTAMTAVGRTPRDAVPTASATAHAPNSSAAGMDRTGGQASPVVRRSSARSPAVAAPLRSASCTSLGHVSATSQAVAAASPGSRLKQ
eukprot:6186500-Pleurochrysis_carterae.AAC.1